MKFLLKKWCVGMTCPRYEFFQNWLKKIFAKCIVRREKRKNLIDSYNLNAHLMNDLGFDRDGNPAQWSTFSKGHPMKAKRTNLCVTDCDDKHLDL